MRSIEIEIRKFAGEQRSLVSASLMGEDEFGSWLIVGRGTRFIYWGEAREHEFDILWLVPRDSWWGAKFWNPPLESDIYVDVTMPAEWDGDRIRICDLDLDVIRWLDGRIELLDEDEFERHRVELAYPDELVARARASAEQMRTAVAQEQEPFGVVWRSWMERMRTARP